MPVIPLEFLARLWPPKIALLKPIHSGTIARRTMHSTPPREICSHRLTVLDGIVSIVAGRVVIHAGRTVSMVWRGSLSGGRGGVTRGLCRGAGQRGIVALCCAAMSRGTWLERATGKVGRSYPGGRERCCN